MAPSFLIALLLCVVFVRTEVMGQRTSGGGLVFQDVAKQAGIISRSPSFKFGGPCVADLDSDGIYDLMLSYHNMGTTQVFFGNRDGTFTLSNFTHRLFDVHGVNVAQRTARSKDRLLAISIGGGSGSNLKVPLVYVVTPQRTFTEISEKNGLGKVRTRGRSTLFMHLTRKSNQKRRQQKGGPDVMFVSYLGNGRSGLRQFAYENRFGNYALRSVPGFEKEIRGRVEVTDIDNDGEMEIISIREMQIYKMTTPFKFRDVSKVVMPAMFRVPDKSLRNTAVAEIDMDNDGDFDLYVARANRTLVSNRGALLNGNTNDVLLQNQNGKYIDVSEKAGIPKGTNSVGVTAGDFNNDGYVDLLVILYKEPDMILLNQGDGTFKRVNGLVPKDKKTVGNHAVAVDYNLDGRVDAIVGHGDANVINGQYRLMKSLLPLNSKSNYLHVKVGNSPSRGATSLHAVVTVSVRGMKMSRRVGSRGAQAGGGSYIDTVHFGLGSFRLVNCVWVRWANKASKKLCGVLANQMIEFGVF